MAGDPQGASLPTCPTCAERAGQLVAAQRERDEALADLTDVKKVRSALDDLGATVKMLEQINSLSAQLVAAQEALQSAYIVVDYVARNGVLIDHEGHAFQTHAVWLQMRDVLAALAAPPRAPHPPSGSHPGDRDDQPRSDA